MKRLSMLLVFVLAVASFNCTAYAASRWDKSTANDGYISVTYDGDFSKTIKVQVTREGTTSKDIFTIISNNPTVIPLQLGNGNYKVQLLVNDTGNSYRILDTFDVKVTLTANIDRFKLPNAYINYNEDMNFLKYYSTSYEKLADTNKKIKTFYDDVVQGYTYDYDKAANVPNGYVPIIDTTFKDKKGICSDYSTLVAGYLRSMGVPTKLIMGYNPEIPVYHCWNEILIDGKWVVVDATYDSSYANAGLSYTMEKDGSKFTIVKVY